MKTQEQSDQYNEDKTHVSSVLFRHGKEFYSSYQLLNNSDKTNFPSIVCLAFSIEIFLKSLKAYVQHIKLKTHTENMEAYTYRDKTALIGGHDLQRLFNNLDNEIKHEITVKYKRIYGTNIENDLGNIKSGFVDWRYMYEGKTTVIHLSTVENIGKFLHIFVREKIG